MENLQEFNKKRTLIQDIFKKNPKEVEIAGWVHNIRALGKIRFLLIKDITGIIQITAIEEKTNKETFKLIDKISRESLIYVKGKIKQSKQAPGGKEILPEKISIINKAEELPIDVTDFSKTELPKRLDYRFLDLHRKRIQAIFKIQNEITHSFREFFYNKNFVEVNLPNIISTSSEGGTELFECQYFEKKVYLAQSPQLYKQMLACSMEKIFTITPVWRAEKHNTTRHLNEARQMDIEVAFADEFTVMKLLEECMKHIIKNIIKKNKEEIKALNLKLKVPQAKYFTFKQIEELMKKHKIEIDKTDLSIESEKKLGELYPDTLIFVHDWPIKGKPFYIMPKENNLSAGFDLIYRGTEIVSGGQRIHIPELLTKRLKANNLNPKDFESYIESFKFGAPPHAGWSIGLERLTQLITEEKNIREAVLFPRDRERITP